MFAQHIVHKQHRISAFNVTPRAVNAYALYLICFLFFAQTSGVHYMHRDAIDLYGLLHGIARGACNRSHDGELCTGQGIEQRAFTGIGLACYNHAHAFPQQGTLLCFLHHLCKVCLQARKLSSRIRLLQKINLFFWEI